MSYLKCKKIETAISRAKKMLIKKANKKGLYENFGQKEIRKIEDTFMSANDYSQSGNCKRSLLNSFDNWCMNYTNNS